MKERTVLGIDPGTNLLGFGVIRIDGRGAHYVDMGVLDLRKEKDAYSKLSAIYDYVGKVCESYSPSDLAIESPFYGKNAQVMFKLGRAQGAAKIACKERGLDIYEYAPRKAKIAVVGNGAATKEQVSAMLEMTLHVTLKPEHLDATDALALALCHYYQLTSPVSPGGSAPTSWAKFIEENPDRVK